MHVTWPLSISTDSPFPIDNIPFGIFSSANDASPRAGIAIGIYVLDISLLESKGFFAEHLTKDGSSSSPASLFKEASLNSFASLPYAIRSAVRAKIIQLLSDSSSQLFSDDVVNEAAFFLQSEVKMHLPMHIGDFTDFMCSRTHSDNCSRMAGAPSSPPGFYAMPTAYNGRSSSIIVSGTPIRRPRGILRIPGTADFEYLPSRRMDYELEMGFFVSNPIPFGTTLDSPEQAAKHIFGFVMLNDWSARDIQFSEMTPLGPFNGKGSGTTISPWIVTLDALKGAEIETQDALAIEKMVKLPAHLRHTTSEHTWNIAVSVGIQRSGSAAATPISSGNLKDLYWSCAQMLSHHSSSGCGLRTGDLLGTGTISSPPQVDETVSSLGCLHETTAAGTKPVNVDGNSVTWIEDGDEIILTGTVVRADGTKIGFGDCSGRLEASL